MTWLHVAKSCMPCMLAPCSHFFGKTTIHEEAMPNISQPTGQDWDAVNVGRGASSRPKAPKSAREVSLMKATGKLTTEKR